MTLSDSNNDKVHTPVQKSQVAWLTSKLSAAVVVPSVDTPERAIML